MAVGPKPTAPKGPDQATSVLDMRRRLRRQPISPKPVSIIAHVPGSGTALGTTSRGCVVGKLTGPPPSPGGVKVWLPGVDARIVPSDGGGAKGGEPTGIASPTRTRGY